MIGRSDAVGDNVSKGYEEDLLTALVQTSNSAAGGYAKGRVAQEATAAIMGRDISWEDFKTEHDDGTIEKLKAELDELKLDSSTDAAKKKILQEDLRKLRGSLFNKKFVTLEEVESIQKEIAGLEKKIISITKWKDAGQAKNIQAKINVARTGLFEKYQTMTQKRSIHADKQGNIYKDITATLKDILKNCDQLTKYF